MTVSTAPLLDIETIKAANDISATIEGFLGQPVNRSGKWLTWFCPFHQDGRNPNFKVNIRDQKFHCYSAQCDAHGDVLDFVQRYLNLDSFIEVIQQLGGATVWNFGRSKEEIEQKRLEYARQRQVREAERKAKLLAERQKALDKIGQMWEKVKWYHGQVSRSYNYWFSQGIQADTILKYKLGYNPDLPIWEKINDEYRIAHHTPTYVIPITYQEKLVNIRHRLIDPIDPNDKYRPEFSGLPAHPFVTRTWQTAFDDSGEIPFTSSPLNDNEGIIVEGETKAMYLEQWEMPILGIPGANSWQPEWIEFLDRYSKIYICLDPGVEDSLIDRIITDLKGNRIIPVKVTLGVKPDDFFVLHRGTIKDFAANLRWGRVIK